MNEQAENIARVLAELLRVGRRVEAVEVLDDFAARTKCAFWEKVAIADRAKSILKGA